MNSRIDELERKKHDLKVIRAHELVRENWTEGKLERVSDEVRGNPLYRPVDITGVDEEFIAEVDERRSDLEAEPVRDTLNRYGRRIHTGWEVVEDGQ